MGKAWVAIGLIGAFGLGLTALDAAAATPTGESTLSQRMTERDLYRAQLITELQVKEQLLARQTLELDGNAKLARKVYDALVAASKKPTGADAPASGEEPLDIVKASAEFEALTNNSNIARGEALRTSREIADLRMIIARISKPLTVKP